VVAGLLLATPAGLAVVAGTAVVTAVASMLTHESDSALGAQVLTVIGIGAMTVSLGNKSRAYRELRAAREELARLAVAEERLRIARDVHDLLGHSLSVIALKSELAAKLVGPDPERAAAELADINEVSRTALGEVRETVQGYRTLALDEALGGARSALAAAGIGYELHEAGVVLPPEVEGVIAWAVREGATNVVRHSGASKCAIRIEADRERAAVEVEDDGTGPTGGSLGTGLSGLAERAERLRGKVEAGARPGGGFRLRLTVPLTS
jgi:two-component system, NarL family, sensor histidine kinase DesK